MSQFLYASRDDAIQALQAYYPADLVALYLKGNDEEGYALDQKIVLEHIKHLQTKLQSDYSRR